MKALHQRQNNVTVELWRASQMAELIVCFGGTKGGSGKSTHATNAACVSAGEGKRTLLVDADEQGSSYAFSMARTEDHPEAPSYTCIRLSGKGVRDGALKMAKDYDRIIIDAGGRDTVSQRAALTVSNVLMMPVVPSQFDVQTLDTVNALVEEIRVVNPDLVAYAFLNAARPRGQGVENQDAADMIGKRSALTYLDAPVRQYQAFRHAASQGLAVTELKRSQRNPDAVSDIETLHRYCFNVASTLKVSHGA
jgi:chromosome partitioning protein